MSYKGEYSLYTLLREVGHVVAFKSACPYTLAKLRVLNKTACQKIDREPELKETMRLFYRYGRTNMNHGIMASPFMMRFLDKKMKDIPFTYSSVRGEVDVMARACILLLSKHNDLTKLMPVPLVALHTLVGCLPEELSRQLKMMKVKQAGTRALTSLYKYSEEGTPLWELLTELESAPRVPAISTTISPPERMLYGYGLYTNKDHYIKSINESLPTCYLVYIDDLIELLDMSEKTFKAVVRRRHVTLNRRDTTSQGIIFIDLDREAACSRYTNYHGLMRVITKILELRRVPYWSFVEIRDFYTELSRRLYKASGDLLEKMDSLTEDVVLQQIEVIEMRTALLEEMKQLLLTHHREKSNHIYPNPVHLTLDKKKRAMTLNVVVRCKCTEKEYDRALDHVYALTSRLNNFECRVDECVINYTHKGTVDECREALEDIKLLYPSHVIEMEDWTKTEMRYSVHL